MLRFTEEYSLGMERLLSSFSRWYQ